MEINMEYIMINDSELKIILEAEDLKEWDVSADELDYADPTSRRMLEDILGCAKRDLGFEGRECRTLLRLFPSLDGGCEIFVTLLPKEVMSDADEADRAVAYRFERLSHLLSVCRRLMREGFEGDRSVWYDSADRWFLMLTPSGEYPETTATPDRLDLLAEYGEEESYRALSLYLSEYATPVCRDGAVALLGKL
jgi:negative regulator of genetic competence, sporulation and motility